MEDVVKICNKVSKKMDITFVLKSKEIEHEKVFSFKKSLARKTKPVLREALHHGAQCQRGFRDHPEKLQYVEQLGVPTFATDDERKSAHSNGRQAPVPLK